MATEQYSDLDFKIRILSSTGDVSKVTNESSINQALYSLFNTKKGERRFNPSFGTSIPALLFEPLDTITGEAILQDLRNNLWIWEGLRIEIIQLNVNVNHKQQQYDIFLAYRIKNTQKTGTLEFVLEKV